MRFGLNELILLVVLLFVVFSFMQGYTTEGLIIGGIILLIFLTGEMR